MPESREQISNRKKPNPNNTVNAVKVLIWGNSHWQKDQSYLLDKLEIIEMFVEYSGETWNTEKRTDSKYYRIRKTLLKRKHD